ncbi:phosphoadenylyl-sulfate reductase [Cellulomonas marina]|uniref:Adenosine 5'-phosphosulfate reductase n=1 Tax=Cellulomonas marina TaxID=988821 RepID=A0A1I0XP19_9CELL|nr:phosphoadenylyl-sulfate reductase [Cellulomonas marina]GIG30059.1 phosphoadenosine phosphosulfate reductase [Cellulomonas marina]SFB02795.1 phosphoadenosine phosphosulfate reductase [Cellulomonas marina]
MSSTTSTSTSTAPRVGVADHVAGHDPAADDALRALALEAEARFAALEADAPDTYEARVDLAARALRWAHGTFGDDLVVASSMGDEVLVHLASQTAPGVDVLFLDTGYHFAETLGTRDAVAATLPVTVRTVLPLLTVAQQDAQHGPRLHDRDPDACCAIRKVEPLQRGLAPYRAWVTGMRRADAPTRTDITLVGWDARRGKVKLNPVAAWTDDDVQRFAAENGVLMNLLRDAGYASIGCEPCTRPVAPGEDARAGRWAGRAKTECGLHT